MTLGIGMMPTKEKGCVLMDAVAELAEDSAYERLQAAEDDAWRRQYVTSIASKVAAELAVSVRYLNGALELFRISVKCFVIFRMWDIQA